MSESCWISAHAFYQGDLDHLLVHGAGALMAEPAAREHIDAFFYLRYWEGGPHVRLRVLPRDGSEPGEIERLLTEGLHRYFAEHPSPDLLTQDDYSASASRLANWEGLDSYARKPHANNSLAFIPYRREHDRYGHGASIEAVERHFVESSRLALRVLTERVPPHRRFTAAYAMILLAWFTVQRDPGRLMEWTSPAGERGTHLLLQDQARLDLLTGWRQDQAVRIAWQMRDLVCSLAALPGTGALIDWARSADALRHALGRREPEARVFSVVDTCAHLVCNRLGVPLPVEGALRGRARESIAVLAGEESRSRGLA